MKLFQLIELLPALDALAKTRLPATIGYRIARAINLVKPEIVAYEGERMKLAELLGTRSDDGQQFKFEDDNATAFIEQMNALTDEEVTLDLPTITPEDLGEIIIEPAHLAVLDGILIKLAKN